MEKYYDVIKRSLELSETIDEGLVYIQRKLDEEQIEDTIDLMGDVIQGFITIQESIASIESQVNSEQFKSLTETIKKDFDMIVDTYEMNDINRLKFILPLLLNDYRLWKNELSELMRKYIAN